MKRIMAVDVGKKRIGIALSDPGRTLASPRGVVEAEDEGEAVEKLVEFISHWDVDTLVVGFPLTLRGEEGEQAKGVERFIACLEKALKKAALNVKLVRWDERFSTAEAEVLLKEAGYNGYARRSRIDAAAAAVILQSYLDSQNQGG